MGNITSLFCILNYACTTLKSLKGYILASVFYQYCGLKDQLEKSVVGKRLANGLENKGVIPQATWPNLGGRSENCRTMLGEGKLEAVKASKRHEEICTWSRWRSHQQKVQGKNLGLSVPPPTHSSKRTTSSADSACTLYHGLPFIPVNWDSNLLPSHLGRQRVVGTTCHEAHQLPPPKTDRQPLEISQLTAGHLTPPLKSRKGAGCLQINSMAKYTTWEIP